MDGESGRIVGGDYAAFQRRELTGQSLTCTVYLYSIILQASL